MACTTACTTKDHPTMGACLRSKGIRVAYADSGSGKDYSQQKRWDANLDLYRSARDQGIQPAGTGNAQVRAALDASDATGSAFQAG